METKNKADAAAKRRAHAARLLQAENTPTDAAKIVGAPRQMVYR
jgi:hypothetical protein